MHNRLKPRNSSSRSRSSKILIHTMSIAVALLLVTTGIATASSHREAPGITSSPQVDATDFYMFRSYEPGREGFVTFIANYNPLQDPYGGPNYYTMDANAHYLIHVDNTGDGAPDLTFQFQFGLINREIALPVGDQMVPIPLRYAGPVTAGNLDAMNVIEAYVAEVVVGDPLNLTDRVVARLDGSMLGLKVNDHAGLKTFPDYDAFAEKFTHDFSVPGMDCDGRVFVGQRKDPFVVNLGEIFDLVNLDPVGPVDGESDDLADKNVTTIALEVPISCVKGDGDIIGGWTAAHLPRNRTLAEGGVQQAATQTEGEDALQSVVTPIVTERHSGDYVQVSRLGMPLVNEVVIGLPDKDRFNASKPENDLANFATYVTNPTLPALLEILFGVPAPTNFPRTDLVAAFVTGIEGLNKFGIGEMQRLNLGIPPTPAAQQSNFGVAGGDLAGFPNGRRPGDDVVDISLRVAMGVLCHAFSDAAGCTPSDAPAGTLPYTDGAEQRPDQFDATFPYLTSPIPGSTGN